MAKLFVAGASSSYSRCWCPRERTVPQTPIGILLRTFVTAETEGYIFTRREIEEA